MSTCSAVTASSSQKPIPPFDLNKSSISKKIQSIFHLSDQEELLADYSSWLFRTTLSKGHLYLTTGHLCFHAFLNSTSDFQNDLSITKSGTLTRCHSRKLNKIVKSWFVLNKSILSWYQSSSPSYFPIGQINLHFCTQISSNSPDSKYPTQFKLFLLNGRVLTLRCDTIQSKEDWVHALNLSILACQHDVQNLKIVIPLTTIDLVEKCDSIQFAQTIRVKIKKNALVQPFHLTSNSKTLTPNFFQGTFSHDYFFGFLQNSQAPFDSINLALNLIRSTSQAITHIKSFPCTPIKPYLHFSLPPIDPSSSSPKPIHDDFVRDSTRFNLPTASNLPSSPRYSSLSLSQPQSGLSTPLHFSHSSLDERSSKFSTALTRIARSSNQFVGSPIRSNSHLVKLHHQSTSSPKSRRNHQSTPPQPNLNSDTLTSPIIDSNLSHDLNRCNQSKHRSSSTHSSHCLQSHIYPPKDSHRLQYSTYKHINPKQQSQTSPQSNTSPITTPRDPSSVDSNKPWALLPGWLKSVPITLSPMKISKSSIPPDTSEDEEFNKSQLTEKDHLKFQIDFNFLNPTLKSNSNRTSMQLLLKTQCNLIRGASSTFGKLYLASPIESNSVKQKNLRQSCVCFKGRKCISNTLIKMILPVEDLIMTKSEGNNLHLITHHQHLASSQDLYFEFSSEDQLKLVHEELNKMIEICQPLNHDAERSLVNSEEFEEEEEEEEDDDEASDEQMSSQPIMFQSTSSSFLTFKPQSKLHITCLTIGSRGDVQPYIALCQKLQLDGHKCRIASHGEYQKWVEGYGIEFYEIGGDPAELMKICVDNGMFTLGFLKEAFSKFRGWLDDLLVSSYQACIGTDLLIESPSTMAGIHIAEAFQIPYFRAFTMPWTRTKEYPHAFAVPDRKMGSGYNYMTYTVFDQVFWKAMSGQVNKWRKEKLGLKSTTYEKLQAHKIPFLYNFSPTVVPRPLDWSEWIHVTGYWFIDEEDPNKLCNKNKNFTKDSTNSLESNQISPEPSTSKVTIKQPLPPSWEPSTELLQFLDRAQSQNKKVVYIGFGSIVVPDPKAVADVIIESIKLAGVYGIISKGWSERLSTISNKKSSNDKKKDKSMLTHEIQSNDVNQQEEDLSMIFHVDSIPHDWLFPRIHAVCHHGGAGTTGASLRAGLPTIIKPFFGDQFFWAERVETLGIGASLRKLTVKNLTQALLNATTDENQIKRAQSVGEQIRSESGAAKAVECIYRDLEYARSLIKKPAKPSDEIDQQPNPIIDMETISRPSRHLSYSNHRKSSTKVQASSPTKLSKESELSQSVPVGLINNRCPPQNLSSVSSTLDCEDFSNNTERMDLMGSSLLILPPSDATTITSIATHNNGLTPLTNQETTIEPSHTHSPTTRQTSPSPSPSEFYFDCDISQNKTESQKEEVDAQTIKFNSTITTDSTSHKDNNHKKDNSASDEDGSSWDILSQGSKSGPSSNELSNSFDQI